MATVEERLKLKRVLIDTWSVKEQLCLASSVLKSGDQNWMSVSRSLKPFAEPSRPQDWYSQKSCAVQYSSLLDYAGTQKRKKRTDKGSEVPVETPGESIVKKLTQERISELQSLINIQKNQFLKLKEEIRLLKNGQLDDRLGEYIKEIEDEKIQKEKDAQAHIQWLKEREEKKLELERAWKPLITTKPSPIRVKLQKSLPRRNSSQSEPSSETESTIDSPQNEPVQSDAIHLSNSEEMANIKSSITTNPERIKEDPSKPITGSLTPTSPLLTNLLKSPSPSLNSQNSILHSAITSSKGQSPTNISMLLNNVSSTSSSSVNPSPPTTVSSSLKNLVTNAIDSAIEVATQKSSTTHISPAAGAPTLSMLLELPPSVPGKPLPQLPQTASITSQIVSQVDFKDEIKIKDHIEEVIEDLKESIPSPDSILDTPKPEVVEILLEEVIGNEENILESVSMEDIESVIESVEKNEKLLAEAQSLRLSNEQSSTKLSNLLDLEKEKITLPDINIDKFDEIKSTPTLQPTLTPTSAPLQPTTIDEDRTLTTTSLLSTSLCSASTTSSTGKKERLNSSENEFIKNNNRNDEIIIKEDKTIKKNEKFEECKYEEVEIVDTTKTDGDSNLEEDTSPILDEQSIADMEVIILGKPENNLIIKENNENDVVTLILGDDKVENKEIKKEKLNDEVKEKEIKNNDSNKKKKLGQEKDSEDNKIENEIKKEQENLQVETLTLKKLEKKYIELENTVLSDRDEIEISSKDESDKNFTKKLEIETNQIELMKESSTEKKDKEDLEEKKHIPSNEKRESKAPELEINQAKVDTNDSFLLIQEKEIEKKHTINENVKELNKKDEKQIEITKSKNVIESSSASSNKIKNISSLPSDENVEINNKIDLAMEIKPKSPTLTPTPQTPVVIPPQIAALRSETPSTEEDRTSDANEPTITPYVGRTTRKRTRANTPVDSKPNSPAFGNNDEEKEYRVWKKSIMLLYSRLAAHKYASLFLKPITDDQAPGYSTFVYKPIDLPTIKKNIETGLTRTTAEFQRDVMLMFTNAIMYNNTKHHVHKMAKQMQSDSIQHIKDFLATQVLANTPGTGDNTIGVSTPTSRRETRETNKQRDFVGLDEASNSSSGSGPGEFATAAAVAASALITSSITMTTSTNSSLMSTPLTTVAVTTTTPISGKRKRSSIVSLPENIERSTKKRKC